MQTRGLIKALCLALIASAFTFIAAPAHAAAGESDTALVTDGTARYAKIVSNSAIGDFNAISIEFWFKSNLASCDGNIVSKGVDYAVYCASGTLNYAFKGGGTVAGTTVRFAGTSGPTTLNPPQYEWHHFAITRATNSTTVTTYWDGQVVSSDQTADGAGSTALANSGDVLNIGARRDSSTFFNGSIDEVRISNVVRTQSEIQADMHRWGVGSETGVVAYYDFNDVSGSTVVDRVGSNNLTLVGSPSLSPIEITTQVGTDTAVVFPRSYLTSQGGWKVPAGVTQMESLVVGGGGAGGSRAGGGGGAGGYVSTARATLTYTPGAVEAITVGQGGVGQNDTKGSNGQSSSIGTRRIALGGGGGGSANGTDNTLRNGASGASGGGAAVGYPTASTYGSATQFSTYTYGLGNNGANGLGANYFQGGGGGGSSSAAIVAAGTTYNDWSDGGNGTSNSITGTTVCYATGGGGGYGLANAGAASLRSHGGNCGSGADPNGGQGAYGKLKGQWAFANTGAGGGAGGFDDTTTGNDKPGGNGGSGIVVLRYLSTLTTTFNGVTTATYRQTSSISVTTSIAAKVTFFANGKRIAGCISVPTNNLVATCTWKPSIRGTVKISATTTPLLAGVAAITNTASAFIGKRTNTR